MSTDTFNRYISIVSNNLGKDARLLFIYDVFPTDPNAYKTYFPAVLRVMDFPAQGYKYNNLSYRSESTWIRAVIKDGIVTDTSENVPVPVGKQIGIVNWGGKTMFTPVVPYENPAATRAVNFTQTQQNAGLGFIPPEGGNPVYVRHFNIAVRGAATAGIGSNMRAYIINGYDYKQGQIITSPISAKIEPLWQQTLANLNEATTFYLTYNSSTSKFTLSTTRGVERVKEISGKELKQQAKEEEANKRRR